MRINYIDENGEIASVSPENLPSEAAIPLVQTIVSSNPEILRTIAAQNMLFSLKEVKKLKGIDFSNHDSIYFGHGNYLQSIELNRKVSQYDLNRIEPHTLFYAQIEPPKELKEQIEKHWDKKIAEKEEREKKRNERKVKKALKLIESLQNNEIK